MSLIGRPSPQFSLSHPALYHTYIYYRSKGKMVDIGTHQNKANKPTYLSETYLPVSRNLYTYSLFLVGKKYARVKRLMD